MIANGIFQSEISYRFEMQTTLYYVIITLYFSGS